MGEFDECPKDFEPTYESDNKLEGNTIPDDFNEQFKEELEATDKLKEDSESTEDGNEGILEQQGYDEAYAEDTEQTDNEEPIFEKLSDDELREQYESVKAHDAALGDQYVKYAKQIGQLNNDRPYYTEKEWNGYIDEKINAQNDVSYRRCQIQSEMRAMENEISKRRY